MGAIHVKEKGEKYVYQRKIVSREQIILVVKNLRETGRKIVLTNGCFDIIHMGHIQYLRKSRCLGDTLIVGINSDNSVRKLKGSNRPLIKEKERASILEALDFVDFVTIFQEDTPLDLIRAIRPNVYTKGGDYDLSNLIGVGLGSDIIESLGGSAILIPSINVHSTTEIIERMNLISNI